MQEQIKDPVGLEINNKTNDDPPYTNGVIYEREVITKWIDHQVKEMGAQFHTWKVIEL